MKKSVMVVAAGLVLLGGGLQAAGATDRLAWWTQDRFGMFVHFGVYALPTVQPSVEVPVVELVLK